MKKVILSIFILILCSSTNAQRMYDGSGRQIGRVDGDRFYDGSGRQMGRMDGERLYDGSGRQIGRGDGVRRRQMIVFFYFFM